MVCCFVMALAQPSASSWSAPAWSGPSVMTREVVMACSTMATASARLSPSRVWGREAST